MNDDPVSELLAKINEQTQLAKLSEQTQLTKLSEQTQLLGRPKRDTDDTENRSTSSAATDPYASNSPADKASERRPDVAEVFRLKKELEVANERMALMDLQLNQSRLAQHTMEEAIGSPFPAAQHLAANITGHNMLANANANVLAQAQAQANPYSRSASPFERGSFNMPQQQS